MSKLIILFVCLGYDKVSFQFSPSSTPINITTQIMVKMINTTTTQQQYLFDMTGTLGYLCTWWSTASGANDFENSGFSYASFLPTSATTGVCETPSRLKATVPSQSVETDFTIVIDSFYGPHPDVYYVGSTVFSFTPAVHV